MKFKVREGFVCLVDTAQKDKDGNVTGIITNTYPEGAEVDFDAGTAAQHAHKLEALDKDAVKFLAPAIVQEESIDSDQVLADHKAALAAAPQ